MASHDPAKKFSAQYSNSREEIAASLNQAIGREEFQPDDSRLTDEVCQEFTDLELEILLDTAIHHEGESESGREEAWRDFVEDTFGLRRDEEEV